LIPLSFGAPRDHIALFIETNPHDHTGYIVQATGTIAQVMSFRHKEVKLEDLTSALSKTCIGTVARADCPRVQAGVDKNLPPAKQFNGAKRIDPSKSLRRCGEWKERAIEALKDQGILKEDGPKGNLA
jgi:hypothetical protein